MTDLSKFEHYAGRLRTTLILYGLFAGILLIVFVPGRILLLIAAAVILIGLLAAAVSAFLPLPMDKVLHNPGKELLREADRHLLQMALSAHIGQDVLDNYLKDWDIEAAPIQSVLLMAYLMDSHPDLVFPDSVTPRLKGCLTFCRFQSLKYSAHFNKLGSALNQAGIPFVILKGGAMRIYRPDFQRWMNDIDLLVTPEDFPRAEQQAEALGYSTFKTPHSTDLHLPDHPGEGLLDLHRFLEMNTAKEADYSTVLVARSEMRRMFSVQGLLPVPEDMVFISLINLYKNLTERSGLESVVTSFFDIGFLVRFRDGFDWEIIRGNARLTGTEFQVYLAARFLSDIVTDVFPPRFMEDDLQGQDPERLCLDFLYDRDILAPLAEKAGDFDIYQALDSHLLLWHLFRSRRVWLYLMRKLRSSSFCERILLKYHYVRLFKNAAGQAER